jgi:hypothetical protein
MNKHLAVTDLSVLDIAAFPLTMFANQALFSAFPFPAHVKAGGGINNSSE